jgi:glycosyltransferase involved in cell wall biosynthesis
MGPGASTPVAGHGARPRVCLVVGQLTIGGLERQLFLLASGLARGAFDVTVVSMARGGVWASTLRQLNVRVEELERRGRLDWRRLMAMRGWFKALRPDIVYSFNYETNAYARLAGLLAGVPILVTGERGIYMSGMMTLVERLLNPFTECVICNAEAVRRDLVDRVGLPEHKLITIRNAVVISPVTRPDERQTARRLIGAADDEIIVGTVARLVWEKNLSMLVEVASHLRDTPVNLRYCIVGSGPEEGVVRAAIRSQKLEDRFILPGQIEDARSLLPGFDLFALTSTTEGLPNTVMEAMAAGLPCVCTDVGGLRELVEPGMTGYLVASDDRRGFAARILELALDPERRTIMGQAGRHRISAGYSVDRLVSQVEQIFLRLLEAAGSRLRGRRLPVDLIGVR